MEGAVVDLARIRAAAAAGAGVVCETPVLESRTLSDRVGGVVALKAESLQRTGSSSCAGRSRSWRFSVTPRATA